MTFSTKQRDYYAILGLSKDATLEQVKEAYRNMAKQYHPDVNTTGEGYQPSEDKFKDVAEAYSVLSSPESRTLYDLEVSKFPDHIYRAHRNEFARRYNSRDKAGNTPKEPYPHGSYAESKRKSLAEQRKNFGVDSIGRYKGGVPQKGKGQIRGNAMGAPHEAHDTLLINMKINADPTEQFVTPEDALAFKHYMNEDKHFIKKKWTWFEAEIDYDYFKFKTQQYGLRWFRNVLIFFFGLGGLAEIYLRRMNRQNLKALKSITTPVDLAKGVKVNGRIIKQGSTGIIKYAD